MVLVAGYSLCQLVLVVLVGSLGPFLISFYFSWRCIDMTSTSNKLCHSPSGPLDFPLDNQESRGDLTWLMGIDKEHVPFATALSSEDGNYLNIERWGLHKGGT